MEDLICVLLHVPAQQNNANDRPLGDVLFCSFYTICDPIPAQGLLIPHLLYNYSFINL